MALKAETTTVPARAGRADADPLRVAGAAREAQERVTELQGAVVSGTTSATPGTQTAHAHGLNKTPDRVVITPKGNGVVYVSAAADGTNIYVTGSAASVPFDAWVI